MDPIPRMRCGMCAPDERVEMVTPSRSLGVATCRDPRLTFLSWIILQHPCVQGLYIKGIGSSISRTSFLDLM